MKIQVRQLQPGDILNGSGETVINISSGLYTPKSKTEVILTKGDKARTAIWGKYTIIGIKERD